MNARSRGCLLGLVVLGTAVSAQAIVVTTALNQTQYCPGQAMRVAVTAFNPEPYPVTLYFPSHPFAGYLLDGEPWSGWELPMTGQLDLAAGGSYTWDLRHNWISRPLSLGNHSAVGVVRTHGESDPVPFQVVAPVLPTESFFVDFDHLPGTTTAMDGIEELWSYGMHFRSIEAGGGMPGVLSSGDNNYVSVGQCTYPTGFNIVLDFDMPVYGITADVGAGSGRDVTMIARDAQGNVLGSMTSVSPAGYPYFHGPLALSSTTPIASVEWWPGTTNAAPRIDNLHVIIPEPAGLLLAAAVLLGCITRRGR